MRFSGLVLPAALRTWCDSGQMQRRALTKCTGDSYNMLCAEKRREGKRRNERMAVLDRATVRRELEGRVLRVARGRDDNREL
jgi:hypothetical protein